MNKSRNNRKWHERNFEWVWEILIVATVAPALIYSIVSLSYVPVI